MTKNQDNILPLDKRNKDCLGVIGPNADNRKALVGNYEGTSFRICNSIRSVKEYLGEDTRVFFSEGCHLFKKSSQALEWKMTEWLRLNGL